MAATSPYRELIQEAVAAAQQDDRVLGVLLTGSLARGDASPGADLDLRFVLSECEQRPFRSEQRDGVRVEREYQDEATARAAIADRPMNVYAYLDGRILYDPQGALGRLGEAARTRFATYRLPPADRDRILWWLRSAEEKVTVAMAAGDALKAAFVTATSSWHVIEGLWAANDKPLPPNSSVRPHLVDLTKGPADLNSAYCRLFLGDTGTRIATWIKLTRWIVTSLDRGT